MNFEDAEVFMWWWRRVRKAQIPPEVRDLFERHGENVIGMVLAGGFNPAAPDLQGIYRNETLKAFATQWLTERGDAHEQREQRLETLEWAIVVLIVMEILLSVYRGFR